MAIQVQWLDAKQTILVHTFDVKWHIDEFYESIDQAHIMMTSVQHTVHSVLDFTRSVMNHGNRIQMVRYANKKAPSNIGHRIMIRPSYLMRQLIPSLQRLNLDIIQGVHLTDTLDEAITLIHALEQYEKRK